MSEVKLCIYGHGGENGLYYDVDKFLDFLKGKDLKWHDRLEDFTTKLDEKVHINTGDVKFKPIYDELKTIAEQYSNALSGLRPEVYKHIKIIPTGSQISGLKVGLPHEADFVFILPSDIDFEAAMTVEGVHGLKTETLKEGLRSDMKKSFEEGKITSNDDRMRILRFHTYKNIPGICIICDYLEDDGSSVGVTMDIVLAKQTQCDTKSKLSNMSLQYIRDHNLEDLLEICPYTLVGRYIPDTGIIENAILGRLDNKTKRGFRVAKYLLNLVHSRKHIWDLPNESFFGFEPDIKSYHLRCLFFKLLVQINGSTLTEQFTGGILALCLLDMVYRVGSIEDNAIYIPEPLTNSFIEKKIKNERLIEFKVLLQTLLDCNLEDIDKFELLNTKGVPTIKRFDYPFTNGYGFGFSPFSVPPGQHHGIWNFLSDEDKMKIKFYLPHGHVRIKHGTETCREFSKIIPVLPSFVDDDVDELDPLLCCLLCPMM